MSLDIGARGLGVQAKAAATALRKFRGITIIPAGDSITQTSSGYAAGNYQYGPGYAEASIFMNAPHWRILRNAGIGGNTTAALLARFQADVLDYRPDATLLMIGTNDIISGMTTAQIATCMTNIETMVKMSIAQGVLPILVTPPAKDSSKPEARRMIPYYYRLAHAYGIPLIDTFKVTVDPATGGYKAGYSDDGTHPNPVGIAAMSAVVGPILQDLGRYLPQPYLAAVSESTGGNPANIIRNGSFALQSVPGTPDFWTPNLTNATWNASTDSALPFVGKDLVYSKTVAGAAYAVSGTAGSLTVGDVVVFSGAINVSGLSSPTGFNVAFEASGQAGLRAMNVWKQNGLFCFSGEFVAQAGFLSPGPNLYVNDVGVYTLRNFTATNRTAMDAIWTPVGP